MLGNARAIDSIIQDHLFNKHQPSKEMKIQKMLIHNRHEKKSHKKSNPEEKQPDGGRKEEYSWKIGVDGRPSAVESRY